MSLKGSAQPLLPVWHSEDSVSLSPGCRYCLGSSAMSVCLCSVLCLSTDPFAPGQSNGLVIASFMKNKCAVVYNTILLHELHFSHCHNGEGKAETTAKDVASFTPLLPSFCYLKSRWVRRKAPVFISPVRAKHSHAVLPGISHRNKMLIQL